MCPVSRAPFHSPQLSGLFGTRFLDSHFGRWTPFHPHAREDTTSCRKERFRERGMIASLEPGQSGLCPVADLQGGGGEGAEIFKKIRRKFIKIENQPVDGLLGHLQVDFNNFSKFSADFWKISAPSAPLLDPPLPVPILPPPPVFQPSRQCLCSLVG